MSQNHLDFEKPIAELQQKIEELKRFNSGSGLDLDQEINNLQNKSIEKTKEIFARLDAWQITHIARHPLRPYTLDYIQRIFTDFQELHGDRMYADDKAIVTGIGRLDQQPVAIIGHQKGRDALQRTVRNFGMSRPEGYRKAQRLMRMAERFGLPLITLIDTPGAYPGVGAEERGQSEAIASSLAVMSTLEVPIVAVIIGEGGSGGALAIGICDKLLMLEYAVYSVISPEGCASILWKSADKAELAAAAMGVTTPDLHKQGLVDEIIPEPLGGAHRDYDQTAADLRQALIESVEALKGQSVPDLLEHRYQRLMNYGKFDS